MFATLSLYFWQIFKAHSVMHSTGEYASDFFFLFLSKDPWLANACQ